MLNIQHIKFEYTAYKIQLLQKSLATSVDDYNKKKYHHLKQSDELVKVNMQILKPRIVETVNCKHASQCNDYNHSTIISVYDLITICIWHTKRQISSQIMLSMMISSGLLPNPNRQAEGQLTILPVKCTSNTLFSDRLYRDLNS